jgi:hypothetical protein
MPVFTRIKNDVLVLTVDGDYTSNELHRVGVDAFESGAPPTPFPVLLDLSGAAGLDGKSQDELRATGAFFAAHRDRIVRVAVIAPAEALCLFEGDSAFASEAGVDVRACPSHADAMVWLAEGDGVRR